mgnify:FL=1|jgi:hypothetical protein
MASTRNKNTQADYNIRQAAYNKSREWVDYQYSSNGKAFDTALPSIGFNPSHMPRSAFSQNPTDIETSLFGINSTNLVESSPNIIPRFKNIPIKHYFETTPLIMPEKLVVPRFQRPFLIP